MPYVAGWLAEDRKSFERGLGHIQALAARIIAALDGSDSNREPPLAAPPTSRAVTDGDHSTEGESDSEPPAAPSPSTVRLRSGTGPTSQRYLRRPGPVG